jgi:hypothetical protein
MGYFNHRQSKSTANSAKFPKNRHKPLHFHQTYAIVFYHLNSFKRFDGESSRLFAIREAGSWL